MMEKENHIVIDEAAAEQLVEFISGPKVILSLWLVQKLGCDLELAAFVSFSAFLSACCKAQGGWFFLEQEKVPVPDPNSESMFLRLGSWKYGVGLGKDAQLRARKRAKQMGILAEKPSKTKARKLEQQGQEKESAIRSAFIFEQMRGAPPRLHYRVDKLKYIAWLGSK